MLTGPRRILIVRLSHLGDVVHGLPVLEALRRAHPQARIAWAVQPEFAGILEGHPALDEVITFERRGGIAGWMRLERSLARFAADWTVDAQGNLKSALVALTARAERRSGMARVDWSEPLGAASLTDSAQPAAAQADGSLHALDRMHALARHVAPGIALDGSAVELFRDEVAPVDDVLGPESSEPCAILHLASANDVRSWPADRFEALARDLARDHRVLIVSGPSEREDGLRLAQTLKLIPGLRHWAGQVGLPELRRVFRRAADQGAVFIGCDSGPMHVAWACGLRVVLLAGPQDARRTGPWPPPGRTSEPARHRVVRATSPLACAPCLARRCIHTAGNVCMQRIEPAQAAHAVRELTLTNPNAFATTP